MISCQVLKEAEYTTPPEDGEIPRGVCGWGYPLGWGYHPLSGTGGRAYGYHLEDIVRKVLKVMTTTSTL